MPQQLSDQNWLAVLSLSDLDGFEELASDMSHFRDWLETPPAVLSPLPAPWDMCTPWQQLLVTKALRPELIEKVCLFDFSSRPAQPQRCTLLRSAPCFFATVSGAGRGCTILCRRRCSASYRSSWRVPTSRRSRPPRCTNASRSRLSCAKGRAYAGRCAPSGTEAIAPVCRLLVCATVSGRDRERACAQGSFQPIIICGAPSQSVEEVLRSHLPTADMQVCKVSLGKERAISRIVQQCAQAGQWLVVDGASDVVQWLLTDLPSRLHDLKSPSEPDPSEGGLGEPAAPAMKLHPDFQLFVVISDTLQLREHERARLFSAISFQLPLPSTTTDVVRIVCVCVRACVCVCLRACMCVCARARVSVCARACACVCKYTPACRPYVCIRGTFPLNRSGARFPFASAGHLGGLSCSCEPSWRGPRRRSSRSAPSPPAACTWRSQRRSCCTRASQHGRARSETRFARVQSPATVCR